jgi:hypothetical protein
MALPHVEHCNVFLFEIVKRYILNVAYIKGWFEVFAEFGMVVIVL